MRSRRFSHWVLVAPPHFMGLLKKELTPELEKHLMHTVDKDLTNLGTDELSARLLEQVRVPVQDREVTAPTSAHH
jgi:protein required for attachment to host cells